MGTDVDLQEAVSWLKTQKVDIITTSLGWYNVTPGDGTGFFANLVASARAAGILWFTAAGNDREAHWGGAYRDTNSNRWAELSGLEINYFGALDGSAVTIPAGTRINVYLRWDDWTNVNQDYNLYLYRWNGSTWDIVSSSIMRQNGGSGQKPTERISYVTSTSAVYGVAIYRYSTTRGAHFELFAPKVADLTKPIYYRSLANLADAPSAVTVAALDSSSPYPQEPYSSQGPTNGPGGVAAPGQNKPELSGYANVSTEAYGAGVFNGTSAATPHVAGAAALVLSSYPGFTPAQVESFLLNRALDMGDEGYDTVFGYGRVSLRTPPVNLVQNKSFELLNASTNRPDSWSTSSYFTRSSTYALSGSYSGRHSSGSNASYTVRQTISGLTAGTAYLISGWVRVPTTSDSFTFQLQVRWLNASGGTISTQAVGTVTSSTGGVWKEAATKLTAPAGTARAQLVMAVVSLNATVYVDDITFVRQ